MGKITVENLGKSYRTPTGTLLEVIKNLSFEGKRDLYFYPWALGLREVDSTKSDCRRRGSDCGSRSGWREIHKGKPRCQHRLRLSRAAAVKLAYGEEEHHAASGAEKNGSG